MKPKFKYAIYVIIFFLVLIGLNVLYNQIKDSQKNRLENKTQQNIQKDSQTKLEIAKDITVYTENNEEVSLSSFKGKPIVINFWASWCVPCQSEMPDFNKVYEEEKEDIHFLMINATTDDVQKDAQQYIASKGYTFPIYYDTKGTASYGYRITGYPTTIFINSDFEIVKVYSGMITKEVLESTIKQIK